MSLLTNSLAHADIVVTMYSTFFIEAAIFNKPLVGIAFDGYKTLDYWNSAKRFFEWDHLRDIGNLGGIRMVRSREELADSINPYFENPKELEAGRKKIVRQQCEFTAGSAGERLADELIKLLKD